MTAYPRSAALIEVLEGLGLRPETDTNKRSVCYNGVVADAAGDSSAAANGIDSTIAPADQLSHGSVGVTCSIEGIVR